MSLADLQQLVWRRLGLRKHLAGRDEIDLLVRLTVENWQGEYYSAAKDDHERQIVAEGTLVAVKRMYRVFTNYDDRQYAMLWSILLQALASAVIQQILRWWLERRANRALLLAWQYELTQ